MINCRNKCRCQRKGTNAKQRIICARRSSNEPLEKAQPISERGDGSQSINWQPKTPKRHQKKMQKKKKKKKKKKTPKREQRRSAARATTCL